MFVKTEVIESLVKNEEEILIRVYGLKFIAAGKSVRFIKSVDDIFLDSHKVHMLKERINKNYLDEVHIDDVIADALLE